MERSWKGRGKVVEGNVVGGDTLGSEQSSWRAKLGAVIVEGETLGLEQSVFRPCRGSSCLVGLGHEVEAKCAHVMPSRVIDRSRMGLHGGWMGGVGELGS